MHIHRYLLSLLDPCNKHSNMKTPLKAYEKELIPFILASAEYNADVFPQSLEVSFNSTLIV